MALTAAYVRLGDGAMDLLTICGNLHPALKEPRHRPGDHRVQLHELTGIRLEDARHPASLTEVA